MRVCRRRDTKARISPPLVGDPPPCSATALAGGAVRKTWGASRPAIALEGAVAIATWGARRSVVMLERLEHLNKLHGTENVGVLRGDLHSDQDVLADVDLKHLLHACERFLGRKAAEVVHEPPIEKSAKNPRCL